MLKDTMNKKNLIDDLKQKLIAWRVQLFSVFIFYPFFLNSYDVSDLQNKQQSPTFTFLQNLYEFFININIELLGASGQ